MKFSTVTILPSSFFGLHFITKIFLQISIHRVAPPGLFFKSTVLNRKYYVMRGETNRNLSSSGVSIKLNNFVIFPKLP